MTDAGQIAAERLAEIARASAPGPGVTRLPFTPHHRQALDLLSKWMADAGLSVRLDAAGTLIGRMDGPAGRGTFLIGSHQDSVREGGAYDGIMGVVLPIMAMQNLKDTGTALPFAVEILAFADEEGVRFPTALLGPRALAGTFDMQVLEMADAGGIRLGDAMSGFGLTPDDIPALRRSAKDVIGYLETHIEQGPVLEEMATPLGIVTAICGIERHELNLTGETGHAGTLPMNSRRDALVGAAQVVAEVNRMARAATDLRATVGQIGIHPNVVNAVPREARLTIEIRSPDDRIREAAGHDIQAFARAVAAETGLKCGMSRTYRQPAQPCDAALSAALAGAAEAATGRTAPYLPSGATHDASAMADLCPIAMLFVRCRGGISHSPDEYASPEDLGHAIKAITRFLTSPDLSV